MKQYCRYCNNLVTGNGTFCTAKNKEFAKRLNHYLVADTHQYYCKVSQDKYNVGYLVDDVLSGIDRIKKEMVGDEE